MPGAASRELVDIADRIEADDYDPAPMRRLKERFVSVAQGGCTALIADLVMDTISGV